MSTSRYRNDMSEEKDRGARLVALGARLAVALGVLGGVGVGVSALYARGGDASVAVPAPTPVLALTVEQSPGHVEFRRFAGRLEPARRTELGFERGGLLAELLVGEGDRVAAGQVVARLDTALLVNERARLAAARGQQAPRLELARLTYDRQQGLTELATSGQRKDEARLAVAEAEAALAETDAALDGLAIELSKSELLAPFAGEIAARHLDEGAVIATGTPVLTLLALDRPQARIGLAPKAAAGLVPGERYTLDHDGRAYPARLAAVRPDLDPRARTVTALFDLDTAPDLPFGTVMTFDAEAWIPGSGFWVPVAALVEGSRGLWTVLTLEGDGSLGSEAVSVVALRGEDAFVQGSLRDGDRIVPGGTHRVRPGQAVRIAQAD
ncbi:MAG TPA: efflux RND transporter periplasmic adaptor subunit [Amaricoccus sp.]|mgnify:CR=1 FL=1|uniref:efflux RND transporter periplasmic adaptor subunit n=1 Tax=Amaricoccus sp. TaxID=1872485 RepID=UPI002BEE042C|nr:efflux RND transporter periplasmic adaptor subunit [Amaricoccus sp.]HMQ92215.1 efflux RND transporter periplasmic adaptor subunit [Amaricoccus sp.]HMR51671.1 efflux RND transporter periplasmic adaptor subunit [Amaricoccus sp.]HMR59050.1 efflux RND transporter periplasmic adaptor subunit [Amaricoccus sp.]HMT98393.1 efflux RND transporter periplasmic adaptor subunit [Amaricoccus sp.]